MREVCKKPISAGQTIELFKKLVKGMALSANEIGKVANVIR